MAREGVVGDEGGGGAFDTGDVEVGRDEGGEAESGVTGRIFLEIGGFVGLVDEDEAEVFQGREEGGTGADDDFRVGGIQEFEPDVATLCVGQGGVEEDDFFAEILRKNRDELGSQGDFGDEEDDGFLVF